MKKRWFNMVMTLLPLFIIVCCQSEPLVADEKLSQNPLTGKWEWVRTDGGIGYHIHETPATTGRQEVWLFLEDKSYQKYVDGALTTEGTYTLEKRDCIHSQEQKWLINFSTPSDMDLMIEHIDGELLELSDEMFDGLGYQFKRIK